MGVIDGQAVSAAITNAAFLAKNQADTMPYDLTLSAALKFPRYDQVTGGAINALPTSKVNVRLSGASSVLNGAVAGSDGQILVVLNSTGSDVTVNSLSGLASSANQFLLNTATITIPANQAALFKYDAAGSKWNLVGSSGSAGSGGSKNYFSLSNINPTFSSGIITPWSACTLTFSGNAPTGAPTLTATNMALATTTVNPLTGTYNGQLTKAAANAQYQGFISGAFTIDREDLAKVLYGSFSYEVVSGTIDLSGSSTQSLEIWIYNTVSGAWTQPAGYRGMNQSTGSGKVVFSFQTDSTAANNSYKIAIITAQTSASAYVVNFDDFQVGPAAIVLGTPVTDFADMGVTTIGGSTSAPSKGTTTIDKILLKRVGDTAEIIYEFYQTTAGASAGSGTYLLSLPTGLSFDTTKLATSGSTVLNGLRSATSPVGWGYLGANNATGANATVVLIPYNSTQFYAHITSSQDTTGAGGGTVDDTFSSTGYALNVANTGFKFYIKAPIAGWSSASQVSSDTDTRVVTGQVSKTGTQAISAGTPTKVTGFTVNSDDLGQWDAVNNWFKVAVSGYYRVSAIARVGSAQVSCSYRLNGTTIYSVSGFNTILVSGSVKTLTKLNAGDTLEFMVYTASAETLSASDTMFQIERLSGPSIITATDSVASKYTSTSGLSFSTADTLLKFETKDFDLTGSYSTTTGLFTAPVSGKYLIGAMIHSASLALTGSNSITLSVFYNGALSSVLGRQLASSVSPVVYTVWGSSEIHCNAGDTLSIYLRASVSGTLSTTAGQNNLYIVRVGN